MGAVSETNSESGQESGRPEQVEARRSEVDATSLARGPMEQDVVGLLAVAATNLVRARGAEEEAKGLGGMLMVHTIGAMGSGRIDAMGIATIAGMKGREAEAEAEAGAETPEETATDERARGIGIQEGIVTGERARERGIRGGTGIEIEIGTEGVIDRGTEIGERFSACVSIRKGCVRTCSRILGTVIA